VLTGERRVGQHLDVRWATPGGAMHRRFLPASRIAEAARLIACVAPRADVYVGVALREGRSHGGRRAISGSGLLYIECDDRDAQARLAGFAYPPTMEIASGTHGHLHLYWRLGERVPSAAVESANRQLGQALGGDPACVDIARVLRPPGTLNHKHDPPRAVRLTADRRGARYTLAELTRGLPVLKLRGAAASSSQTTRREAARTPLERELLAIPGAEYARVLAGRSPDRAGKMRCPFHHDSEPSLQLYPDGTFYCFGSGCARGGTIIDFAAAKWGLGTRGRDFLELRRRLVEEFALR
jgi:hypothetical protein